LRQTAFIAHHDPRNPEMCAHSYSGARRKLAKLARDSATEGMQLRISGNLRQNLSRTHQIEHPEQLHITAGAPITAVLYLPAASALVSPLVDINIAPLLGDPRLPAQKRATSLRQRKRHADDFATELYRWLETLLALGLGLAGRSSLAQNAKTAGGRPYDNRHLRTNCYIAVTVGRGRR
jgi:hypothetical protein